MTTATTAKYPLRQLGKNGPFVSALGFGTMGIHLYNCSPKALTDFS